LSFLNTKAKPFYIVQKIYLPKKGDSTGEKYGDVPVFAVSSCLLKITRHKPLKYNKGVIREQMLNI
jgi:hypothetical protein